MFNSIVSPIFYCESIKHNQLGRHGIETPSLLLSLSKWNPLGPMDSAPKKQVNRSFDILLLFLMNMTIQLPNFWDAMKFLLRHCNAIDTSMARYLHIWHQARRNSHCYTNKSCLTYPLAVCNQSALERVSCTEKWHQHSRRNNGKYMTHLAIRKPYTTCKLSQYIKMKYSRSQNDDSHLKCSLQIVNVYLHT